jgi:uroporphyrinogen decarboxylase
LIIYYYVDAGAYTWRVVANDGAGHVSDNMEVEADANATIGIRVEFDWDAGTMDVQFRDTIVDGVTRQAEGRKVPVVLFTKGGGRWLADMAATGCDALGVDWTCDLADARAAVQDRVALQGNLDPSVLYAPPAEIRAQVARVLASFGHGPGHVFNLGHGIHPDVPPEHALAMVEAVHELSPQYHA